MCDLQPIKSGTHKLTKSHCEIEVTGVNTIEGLKA